MTNEVGFPLPDPDKINSGFRSAMRIARAKKKLVPAALAVGAGVAAYRKHTAGKRIAKKYQKEIDDRTAAVKDKPDEYHERIAPKSSKAGFLGSAAAGAAAAHLLYKRYQRHAKLNKVAKIIDVKPISVTRKKLSGAEGLFESGKRVVKNLGHKFNNVHVSVPTAAALTVGGYYAKKVYERNQRAADVAEEHKENKENPGKKPSVLRKALPIAAGAAAATAAWKPAKAIARHGRRMARAAGRNGVQGLRDYLTKSAKLSATQKRLGFIGAGAATGMAAYHLRNMHEASVATDAAEHTAKPSSAKLKYVAPALLAGAAYAVTRKARHHKVPLKQTLRNIYKQASVPATLEQQPPRPDHLATAAKIGTGLAAVGAATKFYKNARPLAADTLKVVKKNTTSALGATKTFAQKAFEKLKAKL